MTAKKLQRIQTVAVNSMRNLVVPGVNVVVSFLVVLWASDALWGTFVTHLIFITLATHVLSWGNKEYLLRAFSQQPSSIAALWQQTLVVRSMGLVVGVLLLVVLNYEPQQLVWMSVWLLGAFLYQSFDVVVVYTRRFGGAIVAELAGFAFIAAMMYSQQTHLNELYLIQLYAIGTMIKVLLLAITFVKDLVRKVKLEVKLSFFMACLPFFLIGFSGMLQSKADLYLVTYFLNDQEVGQYQVMINLFIYIQAVAGFVLMPFAKNLYRVSDRVSEKIMWKLVLLGIGVLALGIPTAWGLLHYAFHFDFSWDYYLYGALYVLPIFYYLPLIYRLFKQGKERQVMYINFLGAGVNLVLTAVLLHYLQGKGALIGSMLAQWAMLGCYVYHRYQKNNL